MRNWTWFYCKQVYDASRGYPHVAVLSSAVLGMYCNSPNVLIKLLLLIRLEWYREDLGMVWYGLFFNPRGETWFATRASTITQTDRTKTYSTVQAQLKKELSHVYNPMKHNMLDYNWTMFNSSYLHRSSMTWPDKWEWCSTHGLRVPRNFSEIPPGIP